MDDPYNLERFVTAQNAGGTYERAIEELRRGRKTSHWMWFVFPQIAGLGQSHMSRTYAIASLDEAKAYLRHPVLGPRLTECRSPRPLGQAVTTTIRPPWLFCWGQFYPRNGERRPSS
jgi:uncharacterized protein (DUF1810 family)